MTPNQILLRIDDDCGHHIIKRGSDGRSYTIEGHRQRPENKNVLPCYFFPFSEEEVAKEFEKQGRIWVKESKQI